MSTTDCLQPAPFPTLTAQCGSDSDAPGSHGDPSPAGPSSAVVVTFLIRSALQSGASADAIAVLLRGERLVPRCPECANSMTPIPQGLRCTQCGVTAGMAPPAAAVRSRPGL